MSNDKLNAIKFFGIGFLALVFFTAIGFGQGASQSQKKGTDHKADKNLKSVARVNPSTLAMEFNFPMMSYPGRNGNSLPVGINYSSKVWRMDEGATYWYWLPYSCNTQYVSQISPKFGERTTSGWTSTIAFPIIEEKNEVYNQEGKPFSVGMREDLFNNYVQEAINDALNNTGSDDLIYACGATCIGWMDRNDGTRVCQSGWAIRWCDDGDGGGEIGNCPNPGGGGSTPQQTYYVKRVRVRMGDGSTQEFRQSDLIYEGTGASNLGMYLAVDGSGMKLERTANGSTLYLPDGSRYIFSATSTGSYQGAALYQSNEFIDAAGNRSTYSVLTETGAAQNPAPIRQITDTMGREIASPLSGRALVEGKQTIYLPSMEGKEALKYEFDWLHLKPVPCDANNTTNCGLTEGAMEDPNQNAFYYTSQFCFGSYYGNLLANPNNLDDPANEVLFKMNGVGIKSCNPFTGSTPSTAAGVRFNPVLLGKIKLPNGEQYIFKYNQYGEISKIIYPTGSYETFTYEAIPPMGGFNGAAYDQTNRGVKERRVYNSSGALEQRWKYDAQYDPLQLQYKITMTAPKGDDPLGTGVRSERYIHNSESSEITFGFDNPLSGRTYEEKSFDENGVLRSRTLTEYKVKSAPTGLPTDPTYTIVSRDPRVKRTVSIMIENNVALATLSETEYNEPETQGNNAQTDPEYFSHLNVKRTKGYHFASITSDHAQNGTFDELEDYFNNSLLASISETDYLYDPNYKARGISSLPVETSVLNPANQNDVLSKTQVLYDQPSYPTINAGVLVTWQDPNTLYKGKATTVRTWVKDTDTWLETHAQYDNFGNLRKSWDSSGDPNRFTEIVYEHSGDKLYFFAYPTKVIVPAPDPDNTGYGTNETYQAETTYDLATGLPLKVKNGFGQITETQYDESLKPIRVLPMIVNGVATGAITETQYGVPDSTGQYPAEQRFAKIRKQIDGTNWEEVINWYDALGRTIKTQTKDAQGDIFVETKYDNLGRVKQTTNPYRLGDQIYWTKMSYDELGRTNETFAPALDVNNAQSTGTISYSLSTSNPIGTVVTSNDASGRKSRSITNALDQLIRVDESLSMGGTADADLGSISNPRQPTFYTYNTLGKMVKVQQGNQNRYFMYDSLGRLIRVRQPEQEINNNLNTIGNPENNQWTAAYAYDSLGNIRRVTDANGVNIIAEYDKASRVIRRCYTKPNVQTSAIECSQLSTQLSTNTPTVEYFYDGKGLDQQQQPNYAKGKLTKVTSSVSETRYTKFDNFGRLTESEQRTPFGDEPIADAIPRVSKYAYNLSGELVEQTFPSNRVVKNFFNSDGNLTSTSSRVANGSFRTYAANISYRAAGGISQMMLGNGRWENVQFNSRQQIEQIALGTSPTDTSLWKVNFEYGELGDNDSVNTAKNIGNIAKQTITVPTTSFVQTYKYDSLDRLTEVKEKIGAEQNWIQQFGYDRYGNRTSFNQQIGQLVNNQTPTINTAKNRFELGQGFVYDNNGNIIQDIAPNSQNRSFTFNGENKQVEIRDLSISTTAANPDANVVGKYFYDGEGKRVKKQTSAETTIFIYDGFGKLVAEYSNSSQISQQPNVSYTTTDHLGSPRVITDKLGNVKSRRDFMPFGEEIYSDGQHRTSANSYPAGNQDAVRQRFTGYQRDQETMLDFAEARMYESKHGRFTAVDPLLASGKSVNPQTFNRFVYAGNNPLTRSDPDGQIWAERKEGSGYQPVWYNTMADYRAAAKKDNNLRLKTNFVYKDEKGGYTALNPNKREWSPSGTYEQAYWQYGLYTDFQGQYDSLLYEGIGIKDLAKLVAYMKTGDIDGALAQFAKIALTNAVGGVIGKYVGKIAGKYGRALLTRFLESELGKRAVAYVSGKMEQAAIKCLACFIAGTPIHTARGLIPIEKIKVGDRVLSYNEKTKQYEYKTVAQTFTAIKENIVKLRIAGEKRNLTTTTEHPFYVKFKRTFRARSNLVAESDEDGEWKKAGELQIGDKVLRPDGKWTQILDIKRETKPTFVYNFEVEGNHNYFVGEAGILSHNCNIATRALKAADFGLADSAVTTLKGTFGVVDGVATVQVEMIEGNLGFGGFKAFSRLIETARQTGAKTLRIEATFANEELADALVKRFGAVIESNASGSKFSDVIVINF